MVVIEDLVSTGKSSLQVVDVLKESGLEIAGMVSIFTYGFPVATEMFAGQVRTQGVPQHDGAET